MSTSTPVYGRSTLEIWIDLAVQAEEDAAKWDRKWRSTAPVELGINSEVGMALTWRPFVQDCKRRATLWTEIAEFAFAEASRMEETPHYEPNAERLMNMIYRVTHLTR